MRWFTKTVEVEKVVERPVPGDASKASIYVAYTSLYTMESLYHTAERKTVLGYFLSCEDAFKAHPGCKVQEVMGIRIGNEYFAVHSLTPVNVTKPKREKGKGRAA